MLADDLEVPFVELSREIEHFAGCSVAEIHDLYGPNAYRRYERRALEEAIQIITDAVIATPGGHRLRRRRPSTCLLSHCITVWLQASPEDHMGRVVAQGDMRPDGRQRKEAMDDLKPILAGRAAFYAKADLAFDTSGQTLADTFSGLRAAVRAALVRTPTPLSRHRLAQHEVIFTIDRSTGMHYDACRRSSKKARSRMS